MKLNRFKYSEHGDAGEAWRVEGLVFGKFNLIVGRNATGKTRLLRAIARAAGEVSGELRSPSVSADFELVLPDVRDLPDFPESKEAIGDELAEWRAEATEEWGRRAQYYPFGGRMTFKIPAEEGDGFDRLPISEAYEYGIETGEGAFRERLFEWMKEVEYPIAEVLVTKGPRGETELAVREAHRSTAVAFRRLSQGQQRTFSLLTFLSLLEGEGKGVTVLIDDFAEGLDFEHAQLFTRLLLKHVSHWPMQFIIATNDRYVMNSVPLEHWTILVEEGNTIRVFNYSNSRQKFDDFKFTGLSNFDFFSMDFGRGES